MSNTEENAPAPTPESPLEDGKKRRRTLETSKLGHALSELESALNAWDNVFPTEVAAAGAHKDPAAPKVTEAERERMRRTKELLQELRKQLSEL